MNKNIIEFFYVIKFNTHQIWLFNVVHPDGKAKKTQQRSYAHFCAYIVMLLLVAMAASSSAMEACHVQSDHVTFAIESFSLE